MNCYINFEQTFEYFQKYGQAHIFKHWNSLTVDEQVTLLHQASSIDLINLHSSINRALIKNKASTADIETVLEPAESIQYNMPGYNWAALQNLGDEHLRSGRVAAFTVAGGLGSRLAVSFPKGMLPITPIKEKTLFQLFAEKIHASSLFYKVSIPWVIMTNPYNYQQTLNFFEENNFFGINSDTIYLINQRLLPVLDSNYKIILENQSNICLQPNGHGGAMQALLDYNVLEWLTEREIHTLSYFQIDNPLLHCLDPIFIGMHIQAQAEVSSKAITKSNPEEKVGVFCKLGQTSAQVIEYMNLPDELKYKKAVHSESLLFKSGNIAAHLFEVTFLKKISNKTLPIHCIFKNSHINDDKQKEIQIIKLEHFIFDVLHFAKIHILYEVDRALEFSPIKNASGMDSPETAQADLIRIWKLWIQATPTTKNTQELPSKLEISPLFGHCKKTFLQKWAVQQPCLTLDSYIE